MRKSSQRNTYYLLEIAPNRYYRSRTLNDIFKQMRYNVMNHRQIVLAVSPCYPKWFLENITEEYNTKLTPEEMETLGNYEN